MDPQTVDLGFILRQFKNYNLSLNDFEDRLRLQKFIYLLQAHDIYLGYDYSWYLRGPYCTTLAEREFELETIYEDVPETTAKFAYSYIQRRFEKFKKFIDGKENDIDFLEIAASLHLFLMRGNSEEKAIEKVICDKNTDFTHKQCTKILETAVLPLLEETGMVNRLNNNDKKLITDSYKIKYQCTDKVIYDMLVNASDEPPEMYSHNVFRGDQINPQPDTLVVDNAVAVSLLTRD